MMTMSFGFETSSRSRRIKSTHNLRNSRPPAVPECIERPVV